MRYLTTKAFLILAGVILTLILVFMVIFSLSPNTEPIDTPTPTISPKRVIPPVIKQAPTIPPAQGGGIDENSSFIQSSVSEIQKVYASLPYSRDFTSSSGVQVSILIPNQTLQTNKWTLKAQVFGINYNTSPDQQDYKSMQTSFIEAADQVFAWVRQNGADPEKIVFVWGDKKYIQDQAENWLKNP